MGQYEEEPRCADCTRPFSQSSKPKARHVIGAYFAHNRRVICEDCLLSPVRNPKTGEYMIGIAENIDGAVRIERSYEPAKADDLAACLAKAMLDGKVVVVKNGSGTPF